MTRMTTYEFGVLARRSQGSQPQHRSKAPPQ